MTKLEQLIQDLCPNGVKMVKLGDVANIQYGFPFNASLFTDEKNEKPIIRIRDIVPAQTSTYYSGTVEGLDNYIIHRGDILLGMDGYFNMEKWDSEDAYLNQRVCKISTKNKDIVLEGFLFHYLRPQFKKIEQTTAGGSVIHLSAKIINNLQIPLPPLAVQSEIVRLLDKFTLYKSELAAELAARCKQYEHYRNQLLTFDENTKRVKLGEVAENLDSKRKPITASQRVSGKYPYYGASGIVDYVEGYIFDGDYLLISEDGANLVARNSPIAFSIHGKNWVNNHAHVLKFEHRCTRKYIEYYINSISVEPYISAGAQPKLNKAQLNSITIPLPPLEVQERIVAILDRFDALCNDIKIGLPAEIELRQKQYEHYRDRLLTFEAKGD